MAAADKKTYRFAPVDNLSVRISNETALLVAP